MSGQVTINVSNHVAFKCVKFIKVVYTSQIHLVVISRVIMLIKNSRMYLLNKSD